MARRGWRDFLNLNNATAEAKAKRPLYRGKAATSGTIENVGASAPAPKRWGQTPPLGMVIAFLLRIVREFF